MKNRTSPVPSHVALTAVKGIAIFSSVIVAAILGYFSKQLYSDHYKIPWTFIVVFVAAIVTIAALVFTSILSCCCTTISPIFNVIVTIPVLVLWIVGTTLLTWNMYGALGHSCSIANWGNSRGVMVCNIYKTLYAFVLFAAMSQIAQIVLYIRVRRSQSRGNYDKMRDSQDIKLTDNIQPAATPNPVHDTPPNTIHDAPLAVEPTFPQHSREEQPQYSSQYGDESPGWRPGQKPTFNHSQSYTSSHSSHSGSNYNHRNNDHHYGYDSSQSVHMQDFTHQRPQQSTHYESGGYSPSGYGHQQDTYYRERY